MSRSRCIDARALAEDVGIDGLNLLEIIVVSVVLGAMANVRRKGNVTFTLKTF